MDFSFDKVADVLYIKFSEEKIAESDLISSGIIVDYSKGQKVVGIEVLNYSQRKLNLNELVTMHIDEIIPAIVNCS
ncbi:MAG: DUF2283 domain-containing protein [Candidatus Lokiarchaeota archaeon]|nr:DUF2283 domain-containing protein [Candidatus Lokiarchaeota archaeon]